MTTWALKKFQYGYHSKNGKVSDQTERTYWEYYSSMYFRLRCLSILEQACAALFSAGGCAICVFYISVESFVRIHIYY